MSTATHSPIEAARRAFTQATREALEAGVHPPTLTLNLSVLILNHLRGQAGGRITRLRTFARDLHFFAETDGLRR